MDWYSRPGGLIFNTFNLGCWDPNLGCFNQKRSVLFRYLCRSMCACFGNFFFKMTSCVVRLEIRVCETIHVDDIYRKLRFSHLFM